MRQRSLWQDTPITILEVMSAWHDERKYLSRLKIAEKLNRPKSPGLIAILSVAVELGYLAVRFTELPNHVIMFEYCSTGNYDEQYAVQGGLDEDEEKYIQDERAGIEEYE